MFSSSSNGVVTIITLETLFIWIRIYGKRFHRCYYFILSLLYCFKELEKESLYDFACFLLTELNKHLVRTPLEVTYMNYNINKQFI